MNHLAAFLAAYVTILLKVFQQKNVVGNHYRAAFGTSLLLSTAEAAVVLLVVHEGIAVVWATALGAALGCLTGMRLHSRFMRRK